MQRRRPTLSVLYEHSLNTFKVSTSRKGGTGRHRLATLATPLAGRASGGYLGALLHCYSMEHILVAY